MFRLALTTVVFALYAKASAQVAEPTATPMAKVRSLHAEWLQARSRVDEAAKALQDAQPSSELFRKASQLTDDLTRNAAARQEAFQQAFAAAEWTRLDVRADAGLLTDALPVLARDHQHPQAAIDAARFFLANFAKDERVGTVLGTSLPMALLTIGDGSEAKALMQKALGTARGAAKTKLLLTLGDVEAADGDVEQATRCYQLAAAEADAKEKKAIAIRRELIGHPLPAIDSKLWFGAASRSLASMRGKVVLIDFWASWCPPCRVLMSALNELHGANHAAGLEVVGVTRFYANGYLPGDAKQMRNGGAVVQDMNEMRYREHVAAFRKNAGIGYPFVLGTEQDFQTYRISSIPTVVIVGRDGKVAGVMMGASCEPVLRYAVAAALAVGKR